MISKKYCQSIFKMSDVRSSQSMKVLVVYRSSHQRCSVRKGVLRNFTEFTGKQTCNFIKKETLAQVFSCEFCEISENTFFTEPLCTTASLMSLSKIPFSGYVKQIITYYNDDTEDFVLIIFANNRSVYLELSTKLQFENCCN